jgi:hypothetical protein
MLRGSAFSDFTIPAFTLILVVGGTAAVATLLLARRSRFGLISAGLAGALVMSFEFVQVLAIGSPPGPAHVMQLIYFFLGLALVAISLPLMHLEHVDQSPAASARSK